VNRLKCSGVQSCTRISNSRIVIVVCKVTIEFTLMRLLMNTYRFDLLPIRTSNSQVLLFDDVVLPQKIHAINIKLRLSRI
jgi:hypothetical protein